jgi:hypothetical protein
MVVAASASAGPVMVRVLPADVPPPGAGVTTVIVRVPADARSAAVNSAVNEVADTYVVGRAEPSTRTVEFGVKFAPLAVSVTDDAPMPTDDGEMLVSVGAAGGDVTVSVMLFDVPPPGVGLKTEIACEPTDVTSDASRAAVNEVAVPKVVTRSVPSRRTMAPLTKPLPVTVTVKAALPAAMLTGVIAAATGTGFATVSVALVASFVDPNQRRLHVAPTVVGAVNVSVALDWPPGGATCKLLRYFQSPYELSDSLAGQ